MLFVVEDPLGRKIRLTKKRFEEHIKAEHHDFVGEEDRLKRAVENPDLIEKVENNRRLYYQKWGKLLLRVVVRIETNRSDRGHVVTAYRCTKAKGGEVEWRK